MTVSAYLSKRRCALRPRSGGVPARPEGQAIAAGPGGWGESRLDGGADHRSGAVAAIARRLLVMAAPWSGGTYREMA